MNAPHKPPKHWHNNAVAKYARRPKHGPTGRVKAGFGRCDTCGKQCHEYATRCKKCYGQEAYRVQRHAGVTNLLEQDD